MSNDEIKRQAEAERAMATVIDMMSPLWRRLYNNNISEGFTTAESFELLKVYILSQCPYGINGAK